MASKTGELGGVPVHGVVEGVTADVVDGGQRCGDDDAVGPERQGGSSCHSNAAASDIGR